MKNSEKNRDPVAAVKRARADARCALRKLGLLQQIIDVDRARSTAHDRAGAEQWNCQAFFLIHDLAEVLK